jgi:hypothetical protein
MSSTACGFSPSELTPTSQTCNSTISNFLFETSANTTQKPTGYATNSYVIGSAIKLSY